MNRVYPDINGNLRNGNIELYLEIVVDNYLTIQENRDRYIKKVDEIKKGGPEKRSFQERKKEEQYLKIVSGNSNLKLTIQSIVMLNAFFESLINEIGAVELGETYFKKNLDNLRITAKWEIVLKLLYQKNLNKESQYYENMILLSKTRNNLVHYRSSKLKDNTLDTIAKSFENPLQYEEILKKNLDSLEYFFLDLKEIIKERAIVHWGDINEQLDRLKI